MAHSQRRRITSSSKKPSRSHWARGTYEYGCMGSVHTNRIGIAMTIFDSRVLGEFWGWGGGEGRGGMEGGRVLVVLVRCLGCFSRMRYDMCKVIKVEYDSSSNKYHSNYRTLLVKANRARYNLYHFLMLFLLRFFYFAPTVIHITQVL